jgi:hypothetical protein
MIDEFGKFVGNKIPGWFLSHPTASVNINELARELEVSPQELKQIKYVHSDPGEYSGLLF